MSDAYVVSFIDGRAVEAAARKAGWTQNSGSGALDLASGEPSDYEVFREFSSFDAAVAYAATIAEHNYWGEGATVERREPRVDDDDPRIVDWVTVQQWTVRSNGSVELDAP